MIDLSNFKQLTIDGKKIVQLFMNDILVWRAYKNWVRYSINEDGSIYNNGLGYKDGIRVRSGGAEQEYYNASCTGFIKVNPGDVVRLSGWDFSYANNGNAINVSDSSFANIGQFTMIEAHYGILSGEYKAYGYANLVKESEGVWKWVVPPAASGVAYIRVSGMTAEDGSKMIVTVNEEII